MKIKKSRLQQIIREEMSRLNEQQDPATDFYSVKLEMLNKLIDSLDDVNEELKSVASSTALKSVVDLAQRLSAHEESYHDTNVAIDNERNATIDKEFVKHMSDLVHAASGLDASFRQYVQIAIDAEGATIETMWSR